MRALARLWRNAHFRLGLRDMASVAPGMAAWGLVTGVAMVQSGLSPLELVLMALTVFAGSSQLAALPLIVAGAPLWVIVVTAFCVNLRFVVFSAQLRPYMMDLGLAHRLFRGYATTDMSFMLMLRRWQEAAPDAAGRQEQRDYLAGSGALGWSTWVVSNFVGVAFAASIPAKWGLGFAGTLALVGILCALGQGALRIVALLVAGAVAVAAYALPLKLNILLSITVAVGVCLLLEAWWPPHEDEKAV